MHFSVFSTVTAVISLPFLVSAAPITAPKGISIPLSKRTSESGPIADIGALRIRLTQLEGESAHKVENFKKNVGTDHPLAPVSYDFSPRSGGSSSSGGGSSSGSGSGSGSSSSSGGGSGSSGKKRATGSDPR